MLICQGMLPLDDPRQLHVMVTRLRDIRSRAMRRRRWTDFTFSLCVWLTFMFGGGAIFMVCEEPLQNWSYFDGLYMAFVSLTTIGYGNLAPTTSSGRSFFVLWSLLAVPTVTILVANAEDTLIEALRIITISFGNISILPGEGGFTGGLKGLLTMFGLRPSDGSPRVSRNMSPDQTNYNQSMEIPMSRCSFQLLLLDEIKRITNDLRNDPSQEYPIDRWVWYMKILRGFDSITDISNAGHSTPRGTRDLGQPTQVKVVSPPCITQPASIRHRSDLWQFAEASANGLLLSPKEKAEWILEKLLERLRMELSIVMHEEH